MLKLVIIRPGKKGLVLLGLDRNNTYNLHAGKPILIEGAALGLSHDITIMAGETLNDMAAELRANGIQVPDFPDSYSEG